MYTPPAYRWDDESAALDFVAAVNFGALVTSVDGAPLITHLPFLVDKERRVLRAHLARANPHAQHIDGREHVATFMGPFAYISPDWYVTDDDVPTWNYVAVHVAGRARMLSKAADVDALLSDLSDHEESRRHDLATGKFWTIGKLDAAALPRLRHAILVFEIDIARVEAKAKLSQNKNADVAARVVAKLTASPHARERELATMMERTRK